MDIRMKCKAVGSKLKSVCSRIGQKAVAYSGMTARYRTLLRRSILRGLPRFLSIFAIVALGCGFLVGLFSTCPDMQDTADDYYRQYRTMDLQVKGTAGLTEDDLNALRGLPSVETVQAGYSLDLVLTDSSGDDVTARTWGFSEPPESRCNGFLLTEGRMPENTSECVLELPNSYTIAYACGDVFTVTDERAPDGFLPRTLTVVGIAKSPLYMSIEHEPTNVGNGQVNVVLHLMPEAYDLTVYTDALLTFSDAASVSCFSDTYETLIAEKSELAESMGSERSVLRGRQVQEEYRPILRDAEKQLADAKKEWENNLKQAQEQLAQQEAALQAGEAELQTQTDAYLAYYGSSDAFPTHVKELLNRLSLELAAGKNAYETAVRDLETLQAETEESFASAQEDLEALTKKAEEMSSPRWIVSDRTENAGYASFVSNSEKMRSISEIFPVFFCLVAALVAMTAMTRMIEEERVQSGTLGALGYGKNASFSYYILYCLCACIPGSLVGILVGSWLFPKVIWKAYGMMYDLPKLQISIRFGYAALVLASVCGVILLATVAVCFSSLRQIPAVLMRPRAPAAGKRILLERFTRLWQKLSFHYKVTARNLFRYRKRMYMTVVGVAGCTALLLTGFGLRDSIGCIVERQYERVQTYELTVLLRENADWAQDGVLQAFGSSEQVEGTLPVSTETVKLQYGQEQFSLSLYVPSDEQDLEQYLSLHQRGKKQPFSLDDGLLLTEKAAECLGVKAGDTLTLARGDGKQAEVRVGGVCENYILNFACLSQAQYASLFADGAKPNALFVRLREDTPEARERIANQLYESEAVGYLQFNGAVRETFSQTVDKLNFVVYVLIFSAAALALIVLYNLNTINICERKRELATMKVLGFYENEVLGYVFRETVVLTLLGMLVGLVLGVFLHGFVIRTAEMDILMFGHDIGVPSYLLAAAATLLFSVLAGLLSVPALRKVDMVDSLKANE